MDRKDRKDEDDDHELSPEWRAELERRIADLDDPKKWIPGEKALRELRRAQERDRNR